MSRRVGSLVVLSVLVVGLGALVWFRGVPWRLGAAASDLRSPYKSEEVWAVRQIVTDLAQMSVYARTSRAAAVEGVTVEVVPKPPNGYDVTVGLGADDRAVFALMLPAGWWAVDGYDRAAGEILRHLQLAPRPSQALDNGLLDRLLDLRASRLERESERLGAVLAERMLESGVHEQAALLLSAFALREASGRMSDDRPQLCRIIAHLAMANALRGSDSARIEGRIGATLALTFAGRAAAALTHVDALSADAASSPAVASWTRALRLRLTQDWRGASTSGSLLERLEYFRARVATIKSNSVLAELDALAAADEADWPRVAAQAAVSVEAGHRFIADGLDREASEIRDVWQVAHAEPAPENWAETLRSARLGCITPEGPRPLGWSLWSRFFERHLLSQLERTDRFHRHWLDSPTQADAEAARLDRLLSPLPLHAVATCWRTKGPDGSEADLGRLDAAIALARQRPELLNAAIWNFLEFGQHYERLAVGMPRADRWFARPRAPQAVIDVVHRMTMPGPARTASDLDALWHEASPSYDVSKAYLDGTFPLGKRTPRQVETAFGRRMGYDLRVRDLVEDASGSDQAKLPTRRGSCEIVNEYCVGLGNYLARVGREAEAAAAFERAVADPHVDRVLISQHAGWFVDYYHRRGRIADALALADTAAGVGSYAGLIARARLVERLGRLEEAEADWLSVDTRYKAPALPLAFYWRVTREKQGTPWHPALDQWMTKVFPDGLKPFSAPDLAHPPATGIAVMKDTPESKRWGVQAGDVIVALDGWRVENVAQYTAVRLFTENPTMRVAVWRGALREIEATPPGRLLGIEMRTHPIRGYAEE